MFWDHLELLLVKGENGVCEFWLHNIDISIKISQEMNQKGVMGLKNCFTMLIIQKNNFQW